MGVRRGHHRLLLALTLLCACEAETRIPLAPLERAPSGDARADGGAADAEVDSSATIDAVADSAMAADGGDGGPDEDLGQGGGPLPDATSGDVDAAGLPTSDSALPDLALDGPPRDVPEPDGGRPDVAQPDGAEPDVALADAPLPDAGLPDAAPRDLALDAAPPDLPLDGAPPDLALDILPPDVPLPDASPPDLAPQELRVGPAAPYATIGAALDAARAGDLVVVEAGRYEENVRVETGVVLAGALGAVVVGDGVSSVLSVTGDGAVVRGLAFDAAGAATAARLSCDDCALLDCEIRGARGSDGAPGIGGGRGAGLTIDGGARIRVEGCHIHDVVAGRGGAQTPERGARQGGLGVAVYASRTSDLLLLGNLVEDVSGGAGGEGDPVGFQGASEVLLLSGGSGTRVESNEIAHIDGPGRVVGICVLSSNDTTSAFNHVHDLRARTDMSGVLMLFTDAHTATNELVHDLSGTDTAAVRLQGAAGVAVRHLTAYGIAGDGASVLSQSGSRGVVRDSVLVGAVNGVRGEGPDLVEVAYTLTFGLDGEALVNVADGGGNLSADPLFVDPMNGDFRLGPGSPGVDAADPEAPCDQEPGDGACRADLGHTGNTAAAR